MSQNLKELREQVLKLGLEVSPSNAREPYLQALRSFYLQRAYPGGLPYQELSPMLAYDFYAIREREQRSIWNDPDWIAQEKINGVRLILHFVRGLALFAHNRKVSDRTFRRIEVSDHLLFSTYVPDFSATIDAELTSPNGLVETTALLQTTAEESRRRQQTTPFTISVFDIVRWEDQDLKLKKLSERLTYLPLFHTAIAAARLSNHFEFPPVFRQGKREVFERLTAEGKEGIILKNLNSIYRDNSSRDRNAWVKVKREVSLDAYVSGFERGKPGSSWDCHVASLIFSVGTNEGAVVVAKVSNLDWAFRKNITIYDRTTGAVNLDSEVYGAVAHLVGAEFSTKAKRLVSPRISHWRLDLNSTQCIYAAQDLKAFSSSLKNSVPLQL
jgi:hypothetical protein